MHYDQFVKKVQEYADLGSTDDAAQVVRATLETMSERMPRTHRLHLAAQLPEEMKEYFPKHQHMEYLTLEEFYGRIGNRANIGFREAVKYAEAVAWVLREAVAPGELQDILAVFPDEYNELFGRKPASPLSPSSL